MGDCNLRSTLKFVAPLAILALGFALSACVEAKPFQYQKADEIPSGPGLFTGKAGEFTIYRLDEDGRTKVLE